VDVPQSSDERFRLIDEGDVIVVGLPATSVAELLPRVEALEAEGFALAGIVATERGRVAALEAELANLRARIEALECAP
jgi:uncharacterized protein YceH (UPF0502 family)